MNIEMSYFHKIRNMLRIRYYGGKALTAVRTALRRPADCRRSLYEKRHTESKY